MFAYRKINKISDYLNKQIARKFLLGRLSTIGDTDGHLTETKELSRFSVWLCLLRTMNHDGILLVSHKLKTVHIIVLL